MRVEVKKSEFAKGILEISGSKNAALPILCGALLSNKKIKLKNVPHISDIYNLINILRDAGVDIKIRKNYFIVKAKSFRPVFLMKEVASLRASYYLIGASLYRYGTCQILMPGGCDFCARPIDIHLESFKQLGYEVLIENNIINIKEQKKLNEVTFHFNKKSVGATINTIFASLNRSSVVLRNVSLEPEVLDVIEFLKKQGHHITLNKQNIYINKTNKLKRIEYKIMYDRIEAGSYLLLLSNLNDVEVLIKHMPIHIMGNTIKVVKDLGINFSIKKNGVFVTKTHENIKDKYIINVYPSFPTDLQQILTCCLMNRNKYVEIEDYIYPNRISHVDEIKKLKGNIYFEDNTIKIFPSNLLRNEVSAKDLRCAFGLVCLGTQIQDGIVINKAELLLRGYEYPLVKLNNIGIEVKQLTTF